MTQAPADVFDLDMPDDLGHRRQVRTVLAVVILCHILLVWWVVVQGPDLWAPTPAAGAPGLAKGGGGGGGGGGRSHALAYILPPAHEAPAPVAATPVTPPRVVPPPPAPPVRAESTTTVATADTAPAPGLNDGPGTGPGTGGGAGGGAGGGQGPGTGTGTGPGTGGGEGGSIRPPVWSAGALPFGQTPKALRGQHVEVTFWVAADGKVEHTSVAPPIEDDKYRDYFSDVMLTFRFRPARSPAGAAVPGTVTIGFILPNK